MRRNRALIIVDLQNDFVPGGALAVYEGNAIIEIINSLQNKFELVIATKDWHPENHSSFAKTHGKNPGEIVAINGIPQILWPVHCVQDTWGAEFVPGFSTKKIEKIFLKGIERDVDSYSAIFDNAKLRSTGLAEHLKEKGVEDVYITGLTTDYCVKNTALDACELGFNTYVIIDACRGVELNPGDVERAIDEMRAAGAKIIESKLIS